MGFPGVRRAIRRKGFIPTARAVVLVGTLVTGCRAPGGEAEIGPLRVSHAVVPGTPTESSAVLFLSVENRGSTTRRLSSLHSPQADSMLLFGLFGERLQGIDLPPQSLVRFAPGGQRAVLEGLRRALSKGDTVTVELAFASGERVTVAAPVRPDIPATGAAAEALNGSAFVWWCAHLVGGQGDEEMSPATMQAMVVATLVMLAIPVGVGIAVIVWVLRRRKLARS